MLSCTPFLLFDGNCAEAMTFYQKCLGGELTLTKLGDTPMKAGFPMEKHNRIINAYLKSGAIEFSATDWMASPVNPLHSKVEKYSGSEVFDKIKGRSGVIFFQNYWGRGHQGDHIDLWNGYRLTDWASWIRIYARFRSYGLGTDYRKAESVWFWPLP